MTEREKMLAGELYDCGDPELLSQWHRAKDLARTYNALDSSDAKQKDRILTELLGRRGANLWITAPFYVDYGNNIFFGKDVYKRQTLGRPSSPSRLAWAARLPPPAMANTASGLAFAARSTQGKFLFFSRLAILK